METYPSRNQFLSNPLTASLLTTLEGLEGPLELGGGLLYKAFPLYKDEEGNVIMADSVLLAPRYGIVAFALYEGAQGSAEEDRRCREIVEQVPSYLQSRLIRNRALRKTATQLNFEITPLVLAPHAQPDINSEQEILTLDSLENFLGDLAGKTTPIEEDTFGEIVATVDGAKGLIKPKKRKATLPDGSKGKQAELVEAAITNFDLQQKQGIMGEVTGPQRLRGLAGSGKTVVLAMKAALTHLQNEDATIAYTFYTKSLYQHVKRLITRFYRQFDDRDPAWEKQISVLHAWGGQNAPGIYSEACRQHGVDPIRYQDAASATLGDRFDYVCENLLASGKVKPMYDYIFIDEGQDFPLSFIRLARQLARNDCFVLAHDDLQTIFQATTPSTIEIFGADAEGKPNLTFQDDFVLHKCYRNPREILVTAHALGFGLYGERVVQMLESKDHWEDVGYQFIQGEFKSGKKIIVERPEANSLSTLSEMNSIDDLVRCEVFKAPKDEVDYVVSSIEADIQDGLEPDDILVVCVDDRNAKSYLNDIEGALSRKNIQCNNIHTDTYGIRDFLMPGRVTLATVHKAKGNESFMVYVVGVDAVMFNPNVRKRNMLFTAMTRAKGWVRVCGVGEGATQCKKEIKEAKKYFPRLEFDYPPPGEIKRMRRDLAEPADKLVRARRMIERLRQDYSDADIRVLLGEEGKIRKGSKKPQQKKFGK